MIGIDDEDQVGALLAQAGIIDAAEQCLDIVDAALAFAALDFIEHFLLNVDRVNDTVRHALGDTKAEVSGTGTYVSDGIACFDRQRLDQQIGTLVSLAARSIEPVHARMAHDVCDLAAHVKLADAVVRRRSRLVERCRVTVARGCRCERDKQCERGEQNDLFASIF